MKVAGFFLVLIFVSSCGVSEEEISGEQKEFITDQAMSPDSSSSLNAIFISDTLKDSLLLYFSPDIILEIENYLKNFNLASTDTMLEKSYHQGINLFESLKHECENPSTDYLRNKIEKSDGSIYEVFQELNSFNGRLGPLQFGCAAECTEFDFFYDIQILISKSLLTEGNADDDFMNLLFAVDGEYGYAGHFHFKAWDKQYWDYGGSNLLGDGTVTKLIVAVSNYKEEHTLFSDLIEIFHDEIFAMLSSGHSYEFSQEEVLAEYDRIFELNYFSVEELKIIQNQYNQIMSNPGEFQFNCLNGQCSFG